MLKKRGDTIALEYCLIMRSYLLLVYMLKLSLVFFFPLIPQIIVMYLQVLECERNQTLVQTAW